MKSKIFKNVTIRVLILCFVFSGSNVDPEGQPLALGWFTVSKVPKIKFCFDLESMKKKRFEKRINVCKWLKNLYNHYSTCFNDHFKPNKNVLTLKTAEIRPFENLNILNGKNNNNSITSRAGLADQVGCGYVNRLHVGLTKGNSIGYNGKPGEKVHL